MGKRGFLDIFRRDSERVQVLEAELAMQARFDDFMSNEMGFGTDEDKAFADWEIWNRPRLSYRKLDILYRSSGLYRKIINHPANEATREWIDINHEHGSEILDALEDLNLPCLVTRALAWARNYRGAAIVLSINDGLEQIYPVNENAIRSVDVRECLDARYINPLSWAGYGEPEYYQIGADAVESIHRDRLLIFMGEDAGWDNRRDCLGWGESCGDIIYRGFQNYSTDYGAGSTFVKDFNQGVLKVPDLAQQIKRNGVKAAVRIAKSRRRLASIVHAMLIDKEEDWQFVARNAQGFAEMVRLAKDFLCTSTGWPASELFGEAPGASLGESGSYQNRSFYNMVRQIQKNYLKQPMRKIIRYVSLAKGIVEPVKFEFNSLWQLTPKEKAELRKIHAEADKIDIENKVLSAKEVRESRYAMGQWSSEIKLIEGEDPSEKEPEAVVRPILLDDPQRDPKEKESKKFAFDYNPYDDLRL